MQSPSYASEKLGAYITNAKLSGEGRLRVYFWDVYDAKLYAPNGKWAQGQPFALELSYLRDISGEKITERTIDEIRDQGFSDEQQLSLWYEQMLEIFPDVTKGSVITGIYTKTGYSVFYSGNKKIGEIEDKNLSKRFFDIWLNENTSAPDLRRKLLGSS